MSPQRSSLRAPALCALAAFVLTGCPLRKSSRAQEDAGADAGAGPTASLSPPMSSAPAAPRSSSSAKPKPAVGGRVSLGKYGCTSSHYDARSGAYEYRPRGSFVIAADGTYTYYGLERPSAGRYTVDPKSGKLSFAGGYLQGGEATPIEGRADQLLLVAPGLDSRWKCGRTG